MRIQLGIIDIHPDSFNNNNKKKIYSTHWETKDENIYKEEEKKKRNYLRTQMKILK